MKHCLVSIFCLLLLLSFLSACGSGGSDDKGELSNNSCSVIGLSTKVVGGSSCADLQSSPVVRVLQRVKDELGERYIIACSGTFISNRHVITAAHCFGGNALQSYTIIGGAVGIGEMDALQIVPASSVLIHPGYSVKEKKLLQNDVAILTLSQDISLAPLPILVSVRPSRGEIANVYGYGQSTIGRRAETPADSSQLVSGQMRISEVNSTHFYVEYDGSGVNVCFGDSGGPLVLTPDGRTGIVGVVSESTRNDCAVGDITAFTNVSGEETLSWILQIAPEAAII